MFDNLGPGAPLGQAPAVNQSKNSKLALALVALLGGLVILGVAWAAFRSYLKPGPEAGAPAATSTAPAPAATSTAGGLQGSQDATSTDPYGWNSTSTNIRAEALYFSDFYEAPATNLEGRAESLKLPLSVKTDVANYYDFSRKVDLSDKVIEQLNRDGFAVIDNPYAREADDFYGLYHYLDKREVPIFLSDDFLWYYYQNQMKEVFADIRSGSFYQDLWNLDKDFYQIASTRYKKTRARVGQVNDPVFEAERLESAFFAVGLELLRPKANQVAGNQLGNEGKFSAKEQESFVFEMPDYLADDVQKELKLIYEAKAKAKSPVLLYERDYSEFALPAEYQNNAKLANFYLAHRWFNSVFPLYYRSADCKTCLLDQDDWLINFVANSLITKDFADNQELKNRWARIYKVISYFSGLRKDLTYLHYNEVLANLYGAEYDPEKIFAVATDRQAVLAAASRVQAEIAKKTDFIGLEGGYDRSGPSSRPQLGMRLLQTDYWPDYYILKQLVHPRVGERLERKPQPGEAPATNITLCTERDQNKQTKRFRCSGIGLDIMNLLSPVVSNPYFYENTSYRDYTKQSDSLKAQLGYFNTASWHANQYWSTLDIIRKATLRPPALSGPVMTDSQLWRERQGRTALAAWVNLRLPADKWTPNLENILVGGTNESAYLLEPNSVLHDELLAHTKMLGRMLTALRIVRDVDLTGKKLAEVQDDLVKLRAIGQKELAGEPLDDEDQAVLANFARRNFLAKPGSKTANFAFDKMALSENIGGLKLMIVVEQIKDKRYLAIGPVFKLEERTR